MQTLINLGKITSGSIFTISIFIGCSGVVVDKRESAAIASASSPKTSANATCAKPTLALDAQTTYVGQIKPLIQSRCLGCHNTGIINNYSNDKDVISQGQQIVFSVKSGRMPKGSKLSDDEKALFAAWAAGGYLITETTTNNVTAPIAKLPPSPAATAPLGVAGTPAAGAPAAAAPAATIQPVPSQEIPAVPPLAPAVAAPQTCAVAAPVPATPADTTAGSAVAPEDSQDDAGTTANSTSVPGAVGDMTNVPSTTTIGTNTSNASAIAPPLGSAQASASAGASSASASSSAGNK